MENKLDKIIANKKIEIARQKAERSIGMLEKTFETLNQNNRRGKFIASLESSETGIIAEFKRCSPSRGWIFKDARIEDVIPLYAEAGASAISVLTDIDFFGGTLADLDYARKLTDTPLLRKDFVVDEYQLYQAAVYGASAILLIASVLTIGDVKRFGRKAHELGLDVLLEIHNEQELDHINDDVDVVGVNNRNLATFKTDVRASFDLVDKIPNQFLKISESGISDVKTVIELRSAGFKGFLMGENFMKTNNPGKALDNFIKQLL